MHKKDSTKTFKRIFEEIELKEIKLSDGKIDCDEVFNAYTFISDLIHSAKKFIVLVDHEVDETMLDLLLKEADHCNVKIYTDSKDLKIDPKYSKIDVHELKDEEHNFLIIDNRDVYYINAPMNDLDHKWFTFSKFKENILEVLTKLDEDG